MKYKFLRTKLYLLASLLLLVSLLLGSVFTGFKSFADETDPVESAEESSVEESPGPENPGESSSEESSSEEGNVEESSSEDTEESSGEVLESEDSSVEESRKETTGEEKSSEEETEESEDETEEEDDTEEARVANAIISFGMRYIGTPYVYGGTSLTGGIDCSSFTQQCFSSQGISIPRLSYVQVNAGAPIPLDQSQWKKGDLLFYNVSGRVGHVAIYIGGGQILQSSQSMGGVCVSSCTYNGNIPVACRRIIKPQTAPQVVVPPPSAVVVPPPRIPETNEVNPPKIEEVRIPDITWWKMKRTAGLFKMAGPEDAPVIFMPVVEISDRAVQMLLLLETGN